jgi:peptidoglycan-associated lipoprotein
MKPIETLGRGEYRLLIRPRDRKGVQKMTQQSMVALTVILSVTMILGACKKQESHSSPPPSVRAESVAAESAPPADQSASIWADPDSIARGGSATLTWRTTNAADVSINGIGVVQPNGSVRISPSASTIYHLTARGTGGTLDVTAQVTVKELTLPARPR